MTGLYKDSENALKFGLNLKVVYYRLCGHPAATYESCSTSAFKHGRTETIRSCTLEAQAAAKAIARGIATVWHLANP